SPAPAAAAGHLTQKGPATRTANPPPAATQHLPAPRAGMIGSRAGRVKDAYGAGYAGRAPARSWTRPARSQHPADIRGWEQTPAHPNRANHGPKPPQTNACGHRPIQVRRLGAREPGNGLITESNVELGRPCGRITESERQAIGGYVRQGWPGGDPRLGREGGMVVGMKAPPPPAPPA